MKITQSNYKLSPVQEVRVVRPTLPPRVRDAL